MKRVITFLVPICLFLLIPGIVLASELPAGCTVSLHCPRQPVSSCIERIEASYGIKIVLPSSLSHKEVSISAEGQPIASIIRLIMDQLHKNNYSVFIDPEAKIFYVNALETESELNVAQDTFFPFPPELSNQLLSPLANNNVSDNLEENPEVFPPDTQGGKGLTLKELREKQSQADEASAIDPLDWEALPPENGKAGITLRQLQVNLAQQALSTSGDNEFEAFPPSEGNEKGLTLKELKEKNDFSKSDPSEFSVGK